MAVLLSGVLTSGCSSTASNPAACVPRVAVRPATVVPGGTITVSVEAGCDRKTPEGGWTILAAPLGKPELAVKQKVDRPLSDGFSLSVSVPESFPAGDAYAGITEWDYSSCDDGASCPGPTRPFTVETAP